MVIADIKEPVGLQAEWLMYLEIKTNRLHCCVKYLKSDE
jgi:hypothetical protein